MNGKGCSTGADEVQLAKVYSDTFRRSQADDKCLPLEFADDVTSLSQLFLKMVRRYVHKLTSP